MSGSESQLCLLGQGDPWSQEFMEVGSSVATAAVAEHTHIIDMNQF